MEEGEKQEILEKGMKRVCEELKVKKENEERRIEDSEGRCE